MIGFHHFFMEALYLLPTNPLANYYRGYVFRYMEPLFEQHWQLFAPDPALFSMKFWYRCGDSRKKETPWLDPEERFLAEHQRWRLGPNGKITYIYSGLARGYLNDYLKLAEKHCTPKQRKSYEVCTPKIETELKQTDYFKSSQALAEQECAKHLADKTLSNIDWVQFQTVKIYPRQFSKRNEKNSWSRLEFLPSPKIKVSHELAEK